MSIVFAQKPVPLMPGDILLSRLNWHQPNPMHIVVAAVTKSRFVHGTLVVTPEEEWSIEAFGPHLRASATDYECWAYRVNDPSWVMIGQAVANEALALLPTAPKIYGYESAIFVGVQALQGVQKRHALKNAIPYCFEGITDLYVAKEFDVVPDIENGAVLGADIAASNLLIRL